MKKTSIIAFLILGIIFFSFSNEITVDWATYIDGYIEAFYVSGNGNHFVILDKERGLSCGGVNSNDGSSGPVTSSTKTTGYLLIESTDTNYKDLIASLLLAKTMDYKVRFRLALNSVNDFSKLNYVITPLNN